MNAKIRHVRARQGSVWFDQGYRLFKRAPLAWFGLIFMYMLIGGLGNLHWVLGLAMVWLGPLLGAGVMMAGHAAHRGEPIRVSHLFQGFRHRTGELLKLGGLNLGLLFLLVATTAGALFVMMLALGLNPASVPQGEVTLDLLRWGAVGALFVMLMLVTILTIIPLQALTWLAPALVLLRGYNCFQALGAGIRALLANFGAFFVLASHGWLFIFGLTLCSLITGFIVGACGADPIGMAVAVVLCVVPWCLVLVSNLAAAHYAAFLDLFPPQPEVAPE